MKVLTVTVSAKVMNDVSMAAFKEHVESAVKRWGGQYHIDDPLFSANIKQVEVKPLRHGKIDSRSNDA
jgi:hypothetical protein